MKKFLIFGNCQAHPLGQIIARLPQFSSEYELVSNVPPVHLIRNEHLDLLDRTLAEIDLLIFQRVGDAFGAALTTPRLLSLLKPGARSICIPNLFFRAYNPELSYLRGLDASGHTFCEYHDVNIAQIYLKYGRGSVERICAMLQDSRYYSPNFLSSAFSETIAELERREADCDVVISDFIRSHWCTTQLFFTMNHPRNSVLVELASRIVRQLGYDEAVSQVKLPKEYLSVVRPPVYVSVSEHLGWAGTETEVAIKGKSYDLRGYVTGHLDAYVAMGPAAVRKALLSLKESSSCPPSVAEIIEG